MRIKIFPRNHIQSILNHVEEETVELTYRLYRNSEFNNEEISDVLYYTPIAAVPVAEQICLNKEYT